MNERSDETLLDLYFAGDAEAFQIFFERHAGRVIGYAINKGLRREIAQEVMQDAFLRLHKSIHSYESGRPALPWFFTIVHHCVVDVQRQAQSIAVLKGKLEHEAMTSAPSAEMAVSHHSQRLSELLSEEQRQVFEMRVFGELSFAEIASQVGGNEVSLRKVFERARKKLESIFSKED